MSEEHAQLASLLSSLLQLIEEDLPQLRAEVAELRAENKELKRKLAAIPGRGFNERQACIRLGGISRATIKRLRESGQLGFSRAGARVVYTRRDLDEFLERHGLPAERFGGLKAAG